MAGTVRHALIRLAFAAVIVVVTLSIVSALSSGRGADRVTLRDRWIDMKLRIHYDLALGPHRDLEVAVSNGLVTLSGAVPTRAERRRAVDIADHTGGVVGVVDMMTVETPARSPKKPAPQ